MKYTFYIALLLVLYSCNTKTVDKERVDTLVEDSVSIESEVIDEPRVPFDQSFYTDYSHKGIRIFQPTAYSKDSVSKKLFNIMDTIVGLFVDKGTYQLKKCMIEKVNTFEDECGGGAMIEPTLNVKDSCLYLFRGLNTKLKPGKVESMAIDNMNVVSNTSHNFIFNSVNYSFRAEGRIIGASATDPDSWYNVRDYKLYFSNGDKSQCIVKMNYFEDTRTTILYIGDLDGDGKPDLIINSPDHYESVRIMLFLSSFANENELLKLVSIKYDSHSC